MECFTIIDHLWQQQGLNVLLGGGRSEWWPCMCFQLGGVKKPDGDNKMHPPVAKGLPKKHHCLAQVKL